MNEKQKFTKEFLQSQINACNEVIKKNQGALEICQWMLDNCELEEITKPEAPNG